LGFVARRLLAERIAMVFAVREPGDVPDLYGLALPELIEAAVRSGRDQLAAMTLERLVERTQASGTDWALGIEARSRALLAAGPGGEAFYQKAVARLGRGHVALHLARAQLVYGEWLRRENRRVDARLQLSAAYELFDRFGAEGFAERARRELSATGETARRRTAATLSVPQARHHLAQGAPRRAARAPQPRHRGARLGLSTDSSDRPQCHTGSDTPPTRPVRPRTRSERRQT
jgi:hypothetical protein